MLLDQDTVAAVSHQQHLFFRAFPLLVVAFFLIILATVIKPTLLEPFVVAEQTMTRADALVVMAGSRYERIPAAAQLYHQGAAPQILLANDGVRSAWSPEHKRNLSEVEWAREQLLELGVPGDAITLLEFTQSGSYYDAINTRKFVLTDGRVRSLLVVTSHYHSQRTLWTFQRVFSGTGVQIGVYPIPKDPQYKGRWLRVLTIELVKLLYYKMYYGVFVTTKQISVVEQNQALDGLGILRR